MSSFSITDNPTNGELIAAPEVAAHEYSAESIQVFKGLSAVRKRPGMYIGDTSSMQGLVHMVYEAVDNAVDEALAGFCDIVTVTLHADGSVSVLDNGRGIPVDIHPQEGIPAVELIMTQLHAGGKFDSNSYKVSGGLHGVGISVVNALSSWLEVKIWRNNKAYYIRFEDGAVTQKLEMLGETEGKRGTEIKFLPSAEVFTVTTFDFDALEHRLRELAFLNSKVKITLHDLRGLQPRISELFYEGGIQAFLEYTDRTKKSLHKTIYIRGNLGAISLELAMRWNDSYHENILCFTNNIRQRDGGTHLAGFRGAVTRAVNNYISATINNKKKHAASIEPEDIREGLTAILSIKMPEPQFSSQTKDKLVSGAVKHTVESIAGQLLAKWFEENPQEAKTIANRIMESSLAREAARKARDLSRKKGGPEFANLLGKLAHCQEKKPELCELFIVEGDSAGGPAKQGRDRKTQAVLPLRGKVLNVEKARFSKILSYDNLTMLINALGTGIGDEDFDISKLRYHKVIIMTDADVDGAHIRTLLLTFFYRYMPQLIERGYLYIAQPPLYKIRRGQYECYIHNDDALEDFLINGILELLEIKSLETGYIYTSSEIKDFVAYGYRLYGFLKATTNHMVTLEALLLSEYFAHIGEEQEFSTEMVDFVLRILRLSSSDKLEFWNASLNKTNNSLEVTRYKCNTEASHAISLDFISAKLNPQICQTISVLKPKLQYGLEVTVKKVKKICYTSLEVIEHIFSIARKDLYIQRFKGLGEMNADQLGETTLDPIKRRLLKLVIGDIGATEEAFSTLMGELVEPRRAFIQQNALKVEYLDV